MPKGHKANKVEIQVQTTELEFEGEEGEGTNSTHSGKKGRRAPKELNANKRPLPLFLLPYTTDKHKKKRLSERSHIKGIRMNHYDHENRRVTLLPI